MLRKGERGRSAVEMKVPGGGLPTAFPHKGAENGLTALYCLRLAPSSGAQRPMVETPLSLPNYPVRI